jgi:hypothetical protein
VNKFAGLYVFDFALHIFCCRCSTPNTYFWKDRPTGSRIDYSGGGVGNLFRVEKWESIPLFGPTNWVKVDSGIRASVIRRRYMLIQAMSFPKCFYC